MPRESEGAELVRGADGTTSLTDARDRDKLRCAINSAIQTRVEGGEGRDEVLQDVEQLIAAIARLCTGGKHSAVYFPCRPGDSALGATTGSVAPRNHVAVLSVNYGVSGAQVDALRELLACHWEHGTAIISVQEFKIACVSDFSPKYLLLLGAIRGQGAGAVCNLIAVRKDVFEWMDFQFSETCAEWHIVAQKIKPLVPRPGSESFTVANIHVASRYATKPSVQGRVLQILDSLPQPVLLMGDCNGWVSRRSR